MDYDAVLAQVLALLQQEQRVAYRVLKRRFQLDDEILEDLKDDVIYAKKLAVDEEGRVLVWTGGTSSAPTAAAPVPAPTMSDVSPTQGEASPGGPAPPDAERRQLTVLFCDLVDSTVLASQLDPEDLRAVVRAYQDTCAKVIARFDGHIAQYLGDGLLVYFGYPLAHEDDAQRAVRAGLGIVEALGQLNTRLTQEQGVQVAVRLGIHTGLVVVGEVGGGTRQEQLALGETPNVAARLQGIAAPNTLVISAATFPLLGGFFACQPLGTPLLKGQAQPLAVYRVLYESMARSRLEAAGSTGLTPLVGREQEVGLLRERWTQAKDGFGPGGPAQRRSGDWQIAPGAGAAGPGGRRAPGVADAVPVFALSPEHRLVSSDRSAGAGRAPLRAGGGPAAEAQQTGRVPGAVWPAAGGGHAPPGGSATQVMLTIRIHATVGQKRPHIREANRRHGHQKCVSCMWIATVQEKRSYPPWEAESAM